MVRIIELDEVFNSEEVRYLEKLRWYLHSSSKFKVVFDVEIIQEIINLLTSIISSNSTNPNPILNNLSLKVKYSKFSNEKLFNIQEKVMIVRSRSDLKDFVEIKRWT